MEEFGIRIPVQGGNVPAFVIQPEDHQNAGVVLVYPGFSAAKEVQRKEMIWLAEAGFTAVCIDAPHHGERRDGVIDKIATLPDRQAHNEFIKIVREAIREIPAIVEYCTREYSPNIGITGISLGAFVSYGAVVAEARLKAAVPILGSPDWSPKPGEPSEEMQALMKEAPLHSPEKFPPCALFAVNAGKDASVLPAGSRNFLARLQSEYQNEPDLVQYREYPESGHIMRGEDWDDLWIHVIAWFQRFLA